MTYVFAPQPIPTLPVTGSTQLFPVHRIYCVGRNYEEHAREMGHDPKKVAPFFFQKNPGNLTLGKTMPYPDKTADFHFEIELVVALKSGGTNIATADAMKHVYGLHIWVEGKEYDD